jgi:hypothetical protein
VAWATACRAVFSAFPWGFSTRLRGSVGEPGARSDRKRLRVIRLHVVGRSRARARWGGCEMLEAKIQLLFDHRLHHRVSFVNRRFR